MMIEYSPHRCLSPLSAAAIGTRKGFLLCGVVANPAATMLVALFLIGILLNQKMDSLHDHIFHLNGFSSCEWLAAESECIGKACLFHFVQNNVVPNWTTIKKPFTKWWPTWDLSNGRQATKSTCRESGLKSLPFAKEGCLENIQWFHTTSCFPGTEIAANNNSWAHGLKAVQFHNAFPCSPTHCELSQHQRGAFPNVMEAS